MESIEAWHAEFALPTVRIESYHTLARSAAVLDPDTLPRVEGGPYHPERVLPWVAAEDLLGGGPIWVPFELVHLLFVVPEPPGAGCFVGSSNGLASGNTRAEAAVHALCELVERDGLARAEALATTPIGLPAFRALIWDRTGDPLLNPTPAALGSGCHPDPGVALCRALTEAAQSRLTFIAGAREDMSRERYRWLRFRSVLAAHRRMLGRALPGPRRFAARRGCATDTVPGDLAVVLGRLRAGGVHQAALVDLGGAGLPFHVVRAVVPGLRRRMH